jgi:hypothetical protein
VAIPSDGHPERTPGRSASSSVAVCIFRWGPYSNGVEGRGSKDDITTHNTLIKVGDIDTHVGPEPRIIHLPSATGMNVERQALPAVSYSGMGLREAEHVGLTAGAPCEVLAAQRQRARSQRPGHSSRRSWGQQMFQAHLFELDRNGFKLKVRRRGLVPWSGYCKPLRQSLLRELCKRGI